MLHRNYALRRAPPYVAVDDLIREVDQIWREFLSVCHRFEEDVPTTLLARAFSFAGCESFLPSLSLLSLWAAWRSAAIPGWLTQRSVLRPMPPPRTGSGRVLMKCRTRCMSACMSTPFSRLTSSTTCTPSTSRCGFAGRIRSTDRSIRSTSSTTLSSGERQPSWRPGNRWYSMTDRCINERIYSRASRRTWRWRAIRSIASRC